MKSRGRIDELIRDTLRGPNGLVLKVGESAAVITVRESQIEPLISGEILSVRPSHSAAA